MNEIISSRILRAVSIISRQNPTVAALSKLDQSKYRRESGLFLAEGLKLSGEAAGLPQVRYILLSSDDGRADNAFVDLACRAPETAEVIVLPSTTFAKISTENAPQGIITVLSHFTEDHRAFAESEAGETDGKRVLAVDGVQDPGNLGTIIRTACAFGYTHLLLAGCADIYHPKTVRASMGTLFRMQIRLCGDLAEALAVLQKRAHRILPAALSQNTLTLGQEVLRCDDCIVIGNEGHGVSEQVLQMADAALRIPMEAGTESLNAAGAAAVLMWEYYRNFT